MIAGLFGRRDFVAMALNHTNQDVTDIYDQYGYDKEKKMTLNALNKAIEVIVNSPSIESVPDFDELREKVIQPMNQVSHHQEKGIDSQMDFPTKFSSPVSYTLSYARDGLKSVV